MLKSKSVRDHKEPEGLHQVMRMVTKSRKNATKKDMHVNKYAHTHQRGPPEKKTINGKKGKKKKNKKLVCL